MPARPHHFLVRPGLTKQTSTGVVIEPGPIVPLIAIDQLPEWLEIVGLPRELKVEQTVGLSNLGTIVRGQGTYEVNIVHDDRGNDSPPYTVDTAAAVAGSHGITRAGAEHRDGGARTNGTANVSRDGSDDAVTKAAQPLHPAERMMAHKNPPPTSGTVPQTADRTAVPTSRSSSPSPSRYLTLPPLAPYKALKANKQASASAPTSTPPPHGQGLFCRHWCHHGTCKWGFLCRYRHAMPATVEGLAEVGLRDFPTWWTAAMGLTLSNMGGSGGGGGSGPLGLGMPGTGGAGPYHVRMAAERMNMFGGGKKGREFREMARMGYGHGYGQGQKKEREVRAAKEAMTPLDKGRVKFKGVGAALAASSEDRVMVLGAEERSREPQAVRGASEKGREDVVRQTQQAGIQQSEKLVDV